MAQKQYELGDGRKFFDQFRKETDSACAVLARALLEEQLRLLFERIFVGGTRAKDLLKGQGPLASFSARIRLAHGLGQLSGYEAADLNKVREIGNAFAHELDHELSFNAQPVRDRAFALHLPRILLDYNDLGDPISKDELEELRTGPRRRFEVGVGILWQLLEKRIGSASRCTEPMDVLVQLDEARAKGLTNG